MASLTSSSPLSTRPAISLSESRHRENCESSSLWFAGRTPPLLLVGFILRPEFTRLSAARLDWISAYAPGQTVLLVWLTLPRGLSPAHLPWVKIFLRISRGSPRKQPLLLY